MTEETRILLAIREYYITTRQVGHTHMLLNGADNVENPLILVHAARMKDLLRASSKNPNKLDIVSLQEPQGLMGKRKPLLIDNAAMILLIDSALQRIAELEKENYALKDMIK